MVINMIKNFCYILCLIIGFSLPSNATNSGYAEIVKPIIPAVVNISVTQKSTPSSENFGFPQNSQLEELYKFFERFGQGPGIEEDDEAENMKPASAGSGFIISADGYIVTNHHVVDNAEKVMVTLNNNKKLEAKIVGSDSRTDLALLKVESKTPLEFIKFGNSDESRVGDIILIIGNPFGLGNTVTSGIISAQARALNAFSTNIIDNFIQTDAPMNKGNSGGPMFNLKGEVIGINFAIFSPSGGSVGVGFAVPSSAAKPIIEQLMKNGKVSHGWLGVIIQSTENVTESLGLEEGAGALVTSVTKGGPADKAGIQIGDVILAFDGKEISHTKKLPRIVAETPVGKKVDVQLMSKGKKKIIQIIVGEIDAYAENKNPVVETSNKIFMGMSLSSINEELRYKLHIKEKVNGVFVSNVERKSLAAKYGIKRGDIICSVNQQAINNVDEFFKITEDAKKIERKSIMLQLYRYGNIIFLNIPIKNK